MNEWRDFLKFSKFRKEVVRNSFHLFWWYYFKHYHYGTIPDYHVTTHAEAKADRFLDIEPRDHGKSVRWSNAYPLWVVLTNPYDRPVETTRGGGFRYYPNEEEIIVQISAAGALPERWIRRHKTELAFNRKLVDDWGNQSTRNIADGIWASDEILLRNGAHLYSKGTGSQIRGDHPTEVVCDDLEDRKRAENPDLREKDRDYFFADLYGALTPETRLKLVGTIVHEESILNELWKTDAADIIGESGHTENWVKFRFEAMLQDGQPLAPEIWPKPKLEARKALLLKHRPRLWYMEYQNQPQSSEAPIFPTVWFNKELNGYFGQDPKFKEKILPDLIRVSFCDPNAGEKEVNDFTSIITLGFKPARSCDIYVLEAQFFRGTPDNKIRKAVDTWVKWRGSIGFEGFNFQSWIKPMFDRICQEKFYSPDSYTTIYKDRPTKGQPTPAKLDKVSRAQAIVFYFEENRIKFDYSDPQQQELIHELKMFPTGSKDDGVDAITGALWEVKRKLEEWGVKQDLTEDNSRYDEDTGEPIG